MPGAPLNASRVAILSCTAGIGCGLVWLYICRCFLRTFRVRSCRMAFSAFDNLHFCLATRYKSAATPHRPLASGKALVVPEFHFVRHAQLPSPNAFLSLLTSGCEGQSPLALHSRV